MVSERFKKIANANMEFAKKAPYNFCDRWCERCPCSVQRHCNLYKQELEERITCIAHGREEGDLEVMEEVFRWQWEGLEGQTETLLDEEEEMGFEEIDDSAYERTVQQSTDHPLLKAAEIYRGKMHGFLEKYYFQKNVDGPEQADAFETICWYHALLTAKVDRALCGYHESQADNDPDDFALADAVAQFAVCKKAAQLSIQALRRLKGDYPAEKIFFVEMIALLQNILGHILTIEEEI